MIVFGQNIKYDWGNWTVSPCFSGISYRVKFVGKQNDGNGLNSWAIEFKSTYSKDIRFSYAMGDNIQDVDNAIINSYAGSNSKNRSGTYHSGWIKANSTTPPAGYIDFKNGGNAGIMVRVGKIQFAKTNGANTWELTYATCDGGGVCYLCSKAPTSMCKNATAANSNNNSNKPNSRDSSNSNVAIPKSIDEAGGMLKDKVVKITQNSLANLQNTLTKEQELQKILQGNESKYPEAVQYYNEYLKAKKKQKSIGNIGLGIMGVGVIAIGKGVLPLLSDKNNGETNNGLLYGGIGAVVVGTGITLYTISPSKKGRELLDKARSSVTVGTTKNGLGLALNF